MTAPPLRMLCCHVRRQQLIEMEEHGLVRAPLSSFYLCPPRVGLGVGGLTPALSLQVRSSPPSLSSSSSSLPLTFLSLSSSIATQISHGSGAGSELLSRSLREGTSRAAG